MLDSALDQISKLEKLQAQLELKIEQYNKNREELIKKMKEMGVDSNTLDEKILSLETELAAKITEIKNLGVI